MHFLQHDSLLLANCLLLKIKIRKDDFKSTFNATLKTIKEGRITEFYKSIVENYKNVFLIKFVQISFCFQFITNEHFFEKKIF